MHYSNDYMGILNTIVDYLKGKENSTTTAIIFLIMVIIVAIILYFVLSGMAK